MSREVASKRPLLAIRPCFAVALVALWAAGESGAAASETLEVSATLSGAPSIWHEDATFDIAVSNPTSETITDVVVTAWNERNAPPAPVDVGDPVVREGDDDVLDPGESWTYRTTLPAMPTATFEVTATSVGAAVQNTVSYRIGDYPDALRYPVEFSMQPATAGVSPGEALPWSVVATNVSPFPIAAVVGEFRLTPPVRTGVIPFDSLPDPTDTGNGDDVLDVGESWRWQLATDAREAFRLEITTSSVRADTSSSLVEPIGFTFSSSAVELAVPSTTSPAETTPSTIAPDDVDLPRTGSDTTVIVAAVITTVIGLVCLGATRRGPRPARMR